MSNSSFSDINSSVLYCDPNDPVCRSLGLSVCRPKRAGRLVYVMFMLFKSKEFDGLMDLRIRVVIEHFRI